MSKQELTKNSDPTRYGKPKYKKAQNFSSAIKRVIIYIKPYRFILLMVGLMSVLTVSLTIFSTLRMRDLTNIIGQAAQVYFDDSSIVISDYLSLSVVTRASVVLLGIYLLVVVTSYLQGFIMIGTNQKIAKSLRRDINNKVDRLPLSYYDSTNYGDTLSRITNDVDSVSNSINQSFTQLIQAVFQVIMVSVIMFVMSWQLALIVVATVPLSMFVVALIVKTSQTYFVETQTYLGSVNGVIEEVFSGHHVVKAFHAENEMISRFEKFNDQLKTVSRKSQILSSLTYPFMGFISRIGYVAVCVLGGILYTQDLLDIGTLIVFFIYIQLFQNPISQIGQMFNSLQVMSASAERIFIFLDETEVEDESNLPLLTLENLQGEITFQNVTFGYSPNQKVIDQLDLTVTPGQKVAIVGKTGAGKTTLVNLLMRFYEPQEGIIMIDKKPIRNYQTNSVRACFSMVLQDTWLFQGTLKENIAYNRLDVSEEEMKLAVEAANLSYFVKNLPKGLDTMMDESTSISNGQKQLIQIARAILNRAPMLILDEATSNIDTRTEVLIQEAMDKLAVSKTSFIIAHRLSTIQNADIIIVMKQGKIEEKGTHQELMDLKGYYYSLYQAQFKHIEQDIDEANFLNR